MPGTPDLDVHPRDHGVLFYESDRGLVDAVAAYVLEALHNGDAAVVIASRAHRGAVEGAVRAQGIDPDTMRATGSLVMLDDRETLERFLVDGVPDPELFGTTVGDVIRATASTGRKVRAFGEMVSLLWDDGLVTSAMELEGLWNLLRASVPFSLLCGYPMASVAEGELAPGVLEICRLHSEVIGHGSATPSPRPETPALAERSTLLSRGPRAAIDARRFTSEALDGWGRSDLCDDGSIIVSELVANAVLHTDSADAVTIELLPDGVRIAIEDPSSTVPRVRPPSDVSSSGRGLLIVAAIARRWGFRMDARGKAVWAELGGAGAAESGAAS